MLCVNSLAAERARGLVFSETFRDASAVSKNRGTVVESAPGNVKIDFGVTLPGVNNNYITYPCGSLLNKPVINFVIDFWPYFATSEVVVRGFSDSTGGATRYLIYKNANIDIQIFLGGGLVLSCPMATVSNYWRQDQKNVLVVAAITGNNSAYLNNGLIGTNATAWTPTDPPELMIGNLFYGRYTSFKIFTGQTSADLLTLQDARDYYNNSVF